MRNTAKIEEAIIGTILLSPSRYFDVSDVLRPFMFSGDRKDIAAGLWDQVDENGTVDAAGLALYCEKKFQVMQERVFDLPKKAVPESLVAHARQLKEEYLREQEIRIAQNAIDKLNTGEKVSDVVSKCEMEREMLSEFTENEDEARHKKCLGFLERMHEARKKAGLTGVPTGVPTLDNITGGWQKTDLIILAARTGMGKTTSLLDFAMTAIESNFPVLIFSLEMSYNQIVGKFVQKLTGIPRQKISRGGVEDHEIPEIQKAVEWLYERPIFIETACTTLSQIKDKPRVYKRKYGIGLVLIDYLQLIEIKSDYKDNRNNEVGKITRSLKQLAGEGDCDVPIISLSQLSRAVEIRGGAKRPQLSDLRDSGNIEQDADMVMFNYRPDYYNILEDEEGTSLVGVMEQIIAKNRHDRLLTIKNKYSVSHDSYSEITDDVFEVKSKKDDTPTYSAMIPAAARANKVDNSEEIPF